MSSMLGWVHQASISHSQLNSIARDQVNITNYNIGTRTDDAQSLSDRERQIIADWLSPLDFHARQSEVFHSRAKGTGRWLLESKEFEAWRDRSSQTLFCPGIPGAGKTVIAQVFDPHLEHRGIDRHAISSIVIYHLQTRFEDVDDKVATVYIYLDYKKQSQQTPLNLVSSLLKQLVQRHTATLDNVKKLYRSHTARNSRPVLDDITRALNTEISKLAKVFVVVDALDELSEDNGTRTQFLEVVLSLTGPINLMVTSRDLPSISLYFQGMNRLDISAHDQDLKRYVEARVPRWYPANLEKTVTEEIVKMADGMFLLARLHMDSLERKHSPAQVTQALKDLPRGMAGTYDDAMKRIQHQNEDDRELAYRVLAWITFACRPLTVRELQYALAVNPEMTNLDQEEIVFDGCLTSYCAGLVVVDEKSRIIRLVHYSTQEYFEKRRQTLFPDAQTHIAGACLTYLLFDDFGHDFSDNRQKLVQFLDKHPLLDYASQYWGRHARGYVEDIERPILLKFLQSPHRVDCASRILLMDLYGGVPPTKVSALHLCAFFGLSQIIKHLLENGDKADERDSNHRTPLSWAAHNGHDNIVAILMARSDVAVDSKDRLQRTPLLWASRNGHDAVVRRLLAHDAIDVNSKDYIGQTPLFWAICNGHRAVVSLLLDHPAIGVNTKDSKGRTPLSWAAREGQEAVVKQLLTHEAVDINSQDNNGQTPLSWAAENGTKVIVDLLLTRKDVNVDSKNSNNRTPLSVAAGNGHHAVVASLLAHNNVDVNSRDSNDRTPLSWASGNGHPEVVRLLLGHGAVDVNAEDNFHRTPLSWANWEGHVAVVNLLLAHKAVDVNHKNPRGRTALFWAAAKDHYMVVDSLLAHESIDVNPRDDDGRTPLSWMAGRGQEAMVGRLLKHKGIHVNSKDKNGWTPLSWAVKEGHDHVVQLLREHGGVVGHHL